MAKALKLEFVTLYCFGNSLLYGALQTTDYFNLGTLCIIDKTPRTLSADEKDILRKLADVVMDEMEMRLKIRDTVESIKQITSDLSKHLSTTVANLNNGVDKQETIEYLEASSLYTQKIRKQLSEME